MDLGVLGYQFKQSRMFQIWNAYKLLGKSDGSLELTFWEDAPNASLYLVVSEQLVALV
jgi:hypothetical protein